VTGTTINGALFFDFLPSNEYDPANGNVPLGFGNEGGPSITVPATFGYQDLFFNTVSAAFTTSELTIAVNVHTIVFNWRQVLTASTTEFFEDLKLVSSSFPNTFAFGVSGDSLTVSDSENMGQGSGGRSVLFRAASRRRTRAGSGALDLGASDRRVRLLSFPAAMAPSTSAGGVRNQAWRNARNPVSGMERSA
jgi:hypothetical protein